MSLAGLLNQSINVYNKASIDQYGREVFTTASVVASRFQKVNKTKLSPTGESIIVNALAFVPSDTTVSIDDRLDYGGQSYKVINKNELVGRNGSIDHYELELVVWAL